MPIVIAIDELPNYSVSVRQRKKCEEYLKTQGLIEPLQLDAAMELSINWYDPVYLEAARVLGWDTVLVTWPGENK